jgi:hypothetical protein
VGREGGDTLLGQYLALSVFLVEKRKGDFSLERGKFLLFLYQCVACLTTLAKPKQDKPNKRENMFKQNYYFFLKNYLLFNQTYHYINIP